MLMSLMDIIYILSIQQLVGHIALRVLQDIAAAGPVTSTRVAGMSMPTATVSRHSTLAGALDTAAALARAERAAVIDARVRTHLARLEGEGTALDGPFINCDREDQRPLGVRRKEDVVGAITIVRHFDGQELGAGILVLDHAIDLQAAVTERDTVAVSGVQQEIRLLVEAQLGEAFPLQGAQTGLYDLHGNNAIQGNIPLFLGRRSSNFGKEVQRIGDL